MKRSTSDSNNPAPRRKAVEAMVLPPDPPAQRYMHRIVVNIAGKRFELTIYVEAREIMKGPAVVIELPERNAIR